MSNRRPEMIEAVTGKKFGRLTATKFVGVNENRERLWECDCECGAKKTIKGVCLRRGYTKSCGCLRREGHKNPHFTHGHTRKGHSRSTYYSWVSMRWRCTNESHKAYHRYGGRGITICERWGQFENFLADMGERPDGKEIDRIENDGNYCPENCRWVTPTQQGRNRSTNRMIEVDGESKCLSEWAEKTGTKKTTIKERLNRGWTGKDAVFGKCMKEPA